jgi:hypothetical protein
MIGALTHGADQFLSAQAVVGSGAGDRQLPEEVTREAVAHAGRALLSEPAFRDVARGLPLRSPPCLRRRRRSGIGSSEGEATKTSPNVPHAPP